MAVYKVIQDIEAEDKLIGPLTLRQFIYAAIGTLFLYLSYLATTKGAAFMLVLFLPISAMMGFFAFPWMRDQPTEVWALAKIRFMMKPRRRIWSQDGIKDLVTITAPKQVTEAYTNGLTQQEVRSRLHALATTIDTRGWAVKSTQVNMGIQGVGGVGASDRLIAPALPQPVDYADVRASDDILDEQNNADAQRLQNMIDQKAKNHREQLMASLQSSPAQTTKQQPADYWFLNQPTTPGAIPRNMVTFNTQVVAPGTTDAPDANGRPTADEADILAELDAHKQQADVTYGHTHVVQPLSAQQTPPGAVPLQPAAPVMPAPATTGTATPTPDPTSTLPQPATQNAQAPVTPAAQTAILQLASNDDLNIATLAREAERAAPQDEVVIKLH